VKPGQPDDFPVAGYGLTEEMWLTVNDLWFVSLLTPRLNTITVTVWDQEVEVNINLILVYVSARARLKKYLN